MGIFRNFFKNVKVWVEDKIDSIKDFFTSKKYDSNKVSDQVDVAAALAEVRKEYSESMDEAENTAMDEMNRIFDELLNIANRQDYFSDLGSVIKYHKERAEWELKGFVISYIKEHLSQTDPHFKKILEMNPSSDKRRKIDEAFFNAKEQALFQFDEKLTAYTEKVLNEFEERFNNKIKEQEEQANREIRELEKIMADAERGMIDIDKIEDECAPAMEASECIIAALTKAVI